MVIVDLRSEAANLNEVETDLQPAGLRPRVRGDVLIPLMCVPSALLFSGTYVSP